MKLQILGHWVGAPLEGGAASSYLVSDDGHKLLLDCGPGALSLLQKLNLTQQLEAIIISHMHHDHYLDLIPLTSICFLNHMDKAEWKKIKLYVPAFNGRQILKAIGQLMFGDQERFEMTFDIKEYAAEDILKIGTFTVSFQETRHSMPCYSPRITNGEKTIVYTADTGYFDQLIVHSKGADLLLCEATMHCENIITTEHGHLTGGQAGQIANLANVRRLILTHIGPNHEGHRQNIENACKAYKGTVDLASTEAVYFV